MKCPSCGKEGLKYKERKVKGMASSKGERWSDRTNFEVTHSCGYEGFAK